MLRHKQIPLILVRLEDSPLGFGLLALRAAQTLACATPAAKNSPPDCFLHAASSPSEQQAKNKSPRLGASVFGAAGGILR